MSLFRGAEPCSFGPGRISSPGEPPATHFITGANLAVLRQRVREECPKTPGVYGMRDVSGDWIYIGKAKSLRTRLLTYFNAKTRASKERRILDRTCEMGWEPCASEFSALLRELELIQRWRPRFNVLGQPGSREYAYVCVGKAPAPYAYVAQRPGTDAISWFGPVPNSMRTKESVRRLNDVFQLRDCPQRIEIRFANRPELFVDNPHPGCLRVDVGTCLGPCIGSCHEGHYMVQVRRLRSFLSGEDPSTIDRLKHDMDLAAQRLEFERAGSLAVIVESLEWLLEQLGRLRIAQDSYSFVYPVKGVSRQHVWFLIHGGLVVDVIPAPHRWNCPAVHIERLQRVFSQPPVQAGPRTIHENDLLRLVGSWFRTHPNELERTLSVDQAIETMNRWNTSKKTRQSGRSSRSAVVRKSA